MLLETPELTEILMGAVSAHPLPLMFILVVKTFLLAAAIN